VWVTLWLWFVLFDGFFADEGGRFVKVWVKGGDEVLGEISAPVEGCIEGDL